MSKEITVIGAGISGLTTALTLQLLDYETKIYADKTTNEIADKNDHPEFASLYPSASVIPHSVYSDELSTLFQLSQSVFYELRKQTFPGITVHKHFEVFEFDPDRPEYCDWMLNWQPIDEFDTDVPRRATKEELYGWVFDCIFADWPLYLPSLIELYKNSGGSIIQKKLETDDIGALPTDIIVNCSGTGSPSLFKDPVDKQILMRGHLLHKAEAPLITNADDEIISYNYTPQASVYADPSGDACDVYCYPRKDGWILGGSRQTGVLEKGSWHTDIEASDIKSYEVDNIRFPAQIIDLNKEILQETFRKSLDASDDLDPSVGYRYIRSKKNGLRLEGEQIDNKTVYHNYGHGGAGVTLSWGCALSIARQISSEQTDSLKSVLLEQIGKSKITA